MSGIIGLAIFIMSNGCLSKLSKINGMLLYVKACLSIINNIFGPDDCLL